MLLTSAGIVGPSRARLLGAYAVLDAPDGTPLASWHAVDAASRCGLIRRLGQRRYPQRVWLIASTHHPLDVAAALDDAGATTSIYGNLVVAASEPRYTGTRSALFLATRLWRQVAVGDPGVRDFRRMARLYRFAPRTSTRAQLLPAGLRSAAQRSAARASSARSSNRIGSPVSSRRRSSARSDCPRAQSSRSRSPAARCLNQSERNRLFRWSRSWASKTQARR